MPNRIISQQLQMSDRTVRAIVQRFEELGTDEDRPRSGRPTSQVILGDRELTKSRIRRNPQRSTRETGRRLGISHIADRKFVKHQLQLYFCRMHKGHLLTDATKHIG